jgi:hypothetical protein
MENRDRDLSTDDDRMTLDDPLGIAHEPVTAEGTIRASNDEDSVRRRRKRALGEDVEIRRSPDELDADPGVAGVDMGSGGSGTDLKSSR